MMNSGLPGPKPSQADAGFWSACRQHKLCARRCLACGSWHQPPIPMCPKCQSSNLEWQTLSGIALLFSWTRVHIAMHPAVADAIPYGIAVVEFPACDGVRIIARLDHASDSAPAIGAECELYWINAAEGQPLPAFRMLLPGSGAPFVQPASR